MRWGTFELAAEKPRNRHEVAALISEVTGVEIRAERIDPSGLTVPPPMRAMFEHYDHAGLLASPLTLEACLGRPPRSLRDYVAELAARLEEP